MFFFVFFWHGIFLEFYILQYHILEIKLAATPSTISDVIMQTIGRCKP